MTKTEFYSSLATNARMQGYTATKTENGLKLNSVVVSINNNVVTIVDNKVIALIPEFKGVRI